MFDAIVKDSDNRLNKLSIYLFVAFICIIMFILRARQP